MKIKIINAKDVGNIKKERVVLKATSRVDVGGFVLCEATSLPDGQVSNKVRHPFWFPDKVVNANDFVILYTKGGNDSDVQNKSGTTTHIFFWGQDEPVWSKDNSAIALFEIAGWDMKNVI